jgi:hypothetical protein
MVTKEIVGVFPLAPLHYAPGGPLHQSNYYVLASADGDDDGGGNWRSTRQTAAESKIQVASSGSLAHLGRAGVSLIHRS